MKEARLKRDTKFAGNPVVTTGEVFPDGAVIEFLQAPVGSSRPNLLLWKKGKARSANRVEHGNIYEAPELDPSLYRATRFPARYLGYKSLRELFDELSDTIKTHSQISDCDSRLVAAFALSTWLADHLPIAPSLIMSGPDERFGVEVLKFLTCICYRPLLLAELTPGGFRSLPMQLRFTLLINQQELRSSMLRLFRASSYRGLNLTGGRGTLINVFGPKAVFSRSDSINGLCGEGTIQLSLAQSRVQWTGLDDSLQAKIANEFQPRLLSYRLNNLISSRKSPVSAENFSAATRELASALGVCFSEDAQLAKEVVELLRNQDADARAEQLLDVTFVLVEVLWGWIHQGSQKSVPVQDLTKLVNELLRSRGSDLSFRPEEVGWRLRALDVRRHSNISGREVVLSKDIRQRVHDLAIRYKISAAANADNCSECRSNQAAVSKGLM